MRFSIEEVDGRHWGLGHHGVFGVLSSLASVARATGLSFDHLPYSHANGGFPCAAACSSPEDDKLLPINFSL